MTRPRRVFGRSAARRIPGGDDGTALDRFVSAGNVVARFASHAHKNDFWFEERCIVLAFGRATGHNLPDPDVPRRGGKLFTLDAAARRITFETVFVDGDRWGATTHPV